MKENKIEITGWELINSYHILDYIAKQRLATCKATYNLNKIIKMAVKLMFDEKLLERKDDLIRKHSKKIEITENSSDEEKAAATRVSVDPDKMEDFMKEADVFLKKVYTIDYSPVSYLDLELSGLRISLEELSLVDKFIVTE